MYSKGYRPKFMYERRGKSKVRFGHSFEMEDVYRPAMYGKKRI